MRHLVLGALFLLALTSGAAGFILWREGTADLPSVEQILHYRPPTATRVFADDGTQIGEFYFERRYLVPLDHIPPLVRAAFLAAEDANFYRHKGIDLPSILRAFLHNVQRGEVVQGGSTITQQVVKSILLSPEKSYRRKLREVVLALRLESQLSKDEIFYLYLNQIYFGNGAYGIAAASREYFDKDVEDLTLAEGALLAGLPQAPSRYSPVRQPQRAKARQRYVLERMAEEGFVTEAQRAAALAEDIYLTARPPASYTHAPDYVEHVRRLLEKHYGGAAPYQLGLQVHTAMNLRMQAAAEAALREGLEQLDRRGNYRGPLQRLDPDAIGPFVRRHFDSEPVTVGRVYPAVVVEGRGSAATVRLGDERARIDPRTEGWDARIGTMPLRVGDVVPVRVLSRGQTGELRLAIDQQPLVEGALVAIDPNTGGVKAMVGGYDFRRSQFNRAIQALRQPGSAFKPLIYAAAVDRGYTPATTVLDAPIVLPNGSLPAWMPRNYKDKYFGQTTLRNALAQSLNAVTVRLVDDVGLDYLIRYLPRFGVFRHPPPRNLSIALGSAEVTLLDLTRAYAVFATLGQRFEPIFVTKIIDGEGAILDTIRPRFERAMSPATAYLVTSMMQGVVEHGTGRQAKALGRPCAGKTGTTNDLHDAWFIGFTPDLVAGVHVGFDSERSLGENETGGRAAAPIWTRFMERALEGRPIADFPIPDDVTFVNVDRATGLRAVAGRASALEAFRRGTEPTRFAEPEEVPPAAAEPVAATPDSLPTETLEDVREAY